MKKSIVQSLFIVSFISVHSFADDQGLPPTPPAIATFCKFLLSDLSTRLSNFVTQKATGYLLAHNNPNLYGRLAFINRPYQVEGIRNFVGQFGVVRK